jgi:hypothetical protein
VLARLSRRRSPGRVHLDVLRHRVAQRREVVGLDAQQHVLVRQLR